MCEREEMGEEEEGKTFATGKQQRKGKDEAAIDVPMMSSSSRRQFVVPDTKKKNISANKNPSKRILSFKKCEILNGLTDI